MVDISVMLILMRILIHIYIYIAKQIKHIFVSLLEAFSFLFLPKPIDVWIGM